VLAASVKWEQIRRAGRKEIVAGVPFALITAIGWGFYYFLLKIIVQRLNPISTTLFVEVAIALLVLLPLLHFGLKRISRKNLLHAVAGGTLTGLSALAFNTSISLVQVAIVAPIAAASPFLTVVLARIFLKEKLALNQLIAVVVVIAGVIILSM
jgi:drug/metabolite transporter (DMT)-like permease